MSDASNDRDPIPANLDPYDVPVTAELIIDPTVELPLDQMEVKNINDARWWSPIVIVIISLVTFVMASGVMMVVSVLIVSGIPAEEMEIFQDPAKLQAAMGDVVKSRLGLFLSLVVPQAALVLPCLIAATLSPVPFKQRLGLVRGRWPVWSWLAVGAASPFVGILSGLVLSVFVPESQALKDMNNIIRDHGNSGFFFPLALMIGVTPALCEELLFRGYIQQRLTLAFRPAWGIFIASFLFAIFHVDRVHALAVFPLGLFLGWVTYQSGSLLPAMVGHFVNNFVSVLGIVTAPEEGQDILGLPALTLSLSVFAFGLIAVAAIARLAYQTRHGSSSETANSNEAQSEIIT